MEPIAEKKKKILLVEDDPAILDIYKITMKKAGFETETADSGQMAINLIKEASEKPDMVLLDLILPDINGTEVLREIRKNEATKDIFVFILTNQKEGQLLDADGIRPDRVIIKADITPTQLLEIIKEQFRVAKMPALEINK